MPPISDLVRDSKLETKFGLGYTQHIYHVSGDNPRQRKMRIEERWERGRNLGTGSFGTVWLEKLVTENGEKKYRALKEIRKGVQLPKAIDYRRELEAIAKFSHQKVRESSIFVILLYFHFPSLRFSSCINYRKLTGKNSMKCAL
jgi:serine/threonine protein kinase